MAAEALLLVAAAALGAWLYWLKCVETVNTMEIPARIDLYEVRGGMTATSISEDLLGGAVPSFVVRFWVRRHPELQSIQRGHYRIDGKLTLKEILSLMVMGKVTETSFPTITIIEGSTIADVERTMKRFCGSCEMALSELEEPAEFIISTLHSDPSLIGAIGGAASSLEGLLAPATYQVKSPRRINEALGQALRATARLMKEEWPRRGDSVFVKTPYEALIVASIIERETAIADERPQVAAVFYNRMRKRMRLQTDPTVMYGISPDFSGRLTKAQLKADTPYNTYTRQGLPPTPISMPSRRSIMAALHPADTDALYFVAADIDPSNGHVFTSTLRDHNRAVSDYRRKVSDYRRQQDAAAKDQQKDQSRDQSKGQPKSDAGSAKDAASADQGKAPQKSVQSEQKDQPSVQKQDQQADKQDAQQQAKPKPDDGTSQASAKQDQASPKAGDAKDSKAKRDDGARDPSSSGARDAGDQDGGRAGAGDASVKSSDGEVDVDISGSRDDAAAQAKASDAKAASARAEQGRKSAAKAGASKGARSGAGSAKKSNPKASSQKKQPSRQGAQRKRQQKKAA